LSIWLLQDMSECSSTPTYCPHTKDAINKIEMVQRRAARYVTNRYRNTSSVTYMLGDLEWDTLETRRKKIRLTMMYKIINNLIDIRAEEYLPLFSYPGCWPSGFFLKIREYC
jgi:predicted YcjX-like family ATPase